MMGMGGAFLVHLCVRVCGIASDITNTPTQSTTLTLFLSTPLASCYLQTAKPITSAVVRVFQGLIHVELEACIG